MLRFVTCYGTWSSKKSTLTWKKQGKGIDVIIINFELHVLLAQLMLAASGAYSVGD